MINGYNGLQYGSFIFRLFNLIFLLRFRLAAHSNFKIKTRTQSRDNNSNSFI